jgi:hypothetical protein
MRNVQRASELPRTKPARVRATTPACLPIKIRRSCNGGSSGVLTAALVIVLLSAATVNAQERPILDRAVDLANGAALVAHSADLATTVNCLAAKTCTEANPLLLPHVSNPKTFFALKMGVALASYAVKTKTKRSQPKWTLAFAVAETVAFSWIAHHNAKVHREATR